MTNWLTVLRYEVRQQLRRKAYLFLTFGVPILALVVFFGYQAYRDATEDGEDKPMRAITEETSGGSRIGYVDRTPEGLFPAPDSYPEVDCSPPEDFNAAFEAALIKRLSNPYCWQQAIVGFESFEDAEQALRDDAIDALYVVEPDYMAEGTVSQYMTGFSLEVASYEETFQAYLLASLLENVEDPDTYQRLYLRLRDPAVLTEQKIVTTEETETTNDDQNFALVYGFGLMMMLSIFWGGGYVMQSAVQEKESRIVEIVLSSVRPTALLAGKILGMGLLSLLQVGTLVGTFVLIISQAGDLVSALQGVEFDPVAIGLMGVYFVLGFLMFGSLMGAIGAMSTSMRESQNFVVVVTLPAAIPFFFLTFFVEEPNSTLAVVFSMIPLTSPLSMVMRLSVTDVPAGQIALSIGLLIVGVAFAIWLAGRMFRVNTLLSGSLPRLRDLPKLLRG